MAVIAALALGGSVVLSSTANGIAIFMLFGAGLTAGLLGQIAEALTSDTLEEVSRVAVLGAAVRGALPVRAERITADTFGFTRFAIDLGPFGGAQTLQRAAVAVRGRLHRRSWRRRAVGVPAPRLVSARPG